MPWRIHEIALLVLAAALIAWLAYALTRPTHIAVQPVIQRPLTSMVSTPPP